MINEPFANTTSWIHKRNPQVKVIFAIAYSVVVALSNSFSALISALVVSIILIYLSKLNIGKVIKRLAVVFWFLLITWVALPITFEGEPLCKIGPFVITKPGVVLSLQITFKSTAILLSFMALIATMTVATLGHCLYCLKIPPKFVLLLLMTYRYLFVIEEEYQRLWTAIQIRGFRSKTNIHSYKTFAYLIGMLFVRASIRAKRVHQAMLCRGFKGRFYSLESHTFSGQCWIFSIFMLIVLTCLIILECT